MGAKTMNREQYEAMICAQLPSAPVVRFKSVSLEGWVPAVTKCHQNVDYWVREVPGCYAVRGWVVESECIVGNSVGKRLNAHSVVRNEVGELFDITPVHDKRVRPFMQFIPHAGDEQIFWDMKASDISVIEQNYVWMAFASGRVLRMRASTQWTG